MASLGFVGLGVMGSRMVKRLLDAGMTWGDSPRAVAAATEVVFTMVTDTAALHAVTIGPDGILAGVGPGKVYVDMSTCSPAASRDLAA
jgi:3-hydroxyisobutyrate dehydrogenase-like beta-hydroxyacid dehydrogenase